MVSGLYFNFEEDDDDFPVSTPVTVLGNGSGGGEYGMLASGSGLRTSDNLESSRAIGSISSSFLFILSCLYEVTFLSPSSEVPFLSLSETFLNPGAD